MADDGSLDDVDRQLLEENRVERDRIGEEIKELRERNERRKKEREEEEKRLASERSAEDARRKAEEEERKRKKEEEDARRRNARAQKMAEFEKWKNPQKANFVISKKASEGGEDEEVSDGKEGKKSKEQLEAEKRAILNQRIKPLDINGFEQQQLIEKARELHNLLVRLEGEKYDLEKRFKQLQVEMMELAERARQANRVGKEGLKRITGNEEDETLVHSSDLNNWRINGIVARDPPRIHHQNQTIPVWSVAANDKTLNEVDQIQTRFAGAPAKVEMYSKYERQKDKRSYRDRKVIYTGPQFILPPERIRPNKIVRWNEEGMPQYEDAPAGSEPVPAAE